MSMTLYHGTTSLFTEIDVAAGEDYKDFGKGFYLSADKSRAEAIALRNKKILLKKAEITRERVTAIAYCYEIEFDDTALSASGLETKRFDHADIEWIRFILFNRSHAGKQHAYDIVIGPTADDATTAILSRYRRIYGDDYTDEVLQQIIEDVKPEVYPTQYYFGTEEACGYLRIHPGRRYTV